ncbi:MAG: hypothetical protein ISEC1_P0762 [Thiomicrorhabdus sp.]|nr:MAG: hypothetical protein ISEC1_P0762 [Thiomicrorhabdus sp.]
MKNAYGAKISHIVNDSALQPFIMIFDKTISLELRNSDMTLATKIAQQVFFIDPNLNYSLMIANQAQANKIKNLSSATNVSGVNIDFERFQKILTGSL